MHNAQKYGIVLKKMKQFVNERDWKKFHDPKNLSISICLEAAELMEHFQWKEKEEIAEYVKNKSNKEEISDEIADVAMYLIELSEDLKIDILEAILRKIEKNKMKYPAEKVKGRALKYNKL